jgi:probable HAF family extracellular repeat protein
MKEAAASTIGPRRGPQLESPLISARKTLLGRKGERMSALRRVRNFWTLWVTTFVLACFGNAFAQASYTVTDLGSLGKDNLGCAMSVNNEGWTEIMAGSLPPGEQDSLSGTLLNGRALMGVDRFKFDLGTLGGQNTWMNWGQINDFAQIVGYSETSVPDPNGEDVCGFGTHLTCRPFLWHPFHMTALPTLGGNNGQASGINNHGQIAGSAENGAVDTSCPAGTTNNRIVLGALWENDKAHALNPVGSDPDAIAFGINDNGQVVGYSGTCTLANHAVVWEHHTAVPLPDLGVAGNSIAWGINDQGQIVGEVFSADGSTVYAALWQNGVITNLGTLPGDFGSLASGINRKGDVVVGSTWDSNFDWSHAFIWQNGVMTDLNTLLPASSNLYATMGNKINDFGQISGMATVLTGPDAGNIHAFLATPVNQSIGWSIADVARSHPKTNPPAKVGDRFVHRFGPGPLVR